MTDHVAEAKRQRVNDRRRAGRVRVGRPTELCPTCRRPIEVGRMAAHCRLSH